MKSKWLVICLFAILPGMQAQPFDTLLSQFNYIVELYPLEDSTYILIGRGDHYCVGRIDAKANFIWLRDLSQGVESAIYDYQVNLTASDTAIQILFGDFECDYYPGHQYECVTISIDGKIRDSQSWPGSWGRPFLLSGLQGQPRIGITGNPYFILIDVLGDTVQVLLTWPGGDTTNWDLIGAPRFLAICPNGDLIIGGSLFVFMLHLESGTYKVYDSGSGLLVGSHLFCLEDSAFIELRDKAFIRWSRGYQEEIFKSNWYLASYNVEWRDPYLQVYTEDFEGNDTIFLLDKYLTIQSTYPVPDLPGHQHQVVTPQTIFTIGGGNIFYDSGFLGSENRTSHSGPHRYDIEFTNLEIGPYDSVHWVKGGLYQYDIAKAQVTIRNNCDYTINEAVIAYHARNPLSCFDTIWERKIENIDLQPGESGVFDIHDIFIRREYHFANYYDCFYLLRPDNHLDDNFEDNTFCEKLELLPRRADPFPIHHRETIMSDQLTFLSPEKIDFHLRIVSLSGQPLFSTGANTYSNFTVDLSTLPPGMFVLQYTILATGQVYIEKMIKP